MSLIQGNATAILYVRRGFTWACLFQVFYQGILKDNRMKTAKYLLLLVLPFFVLSVHAQKADSSSAKLMTKLVGIWVIESNGKPSTKAATDTKELKTLQFGLDDHFVLKKGTVTIDSGSVRANESQSEVYLESAQDKAHPQEWHVLLNSKNSMTLTAKKGSRMAGTRYACVKFKDF
jgi:hypothetical protein